MIDNLRTFIRQRIESQTVDLYAETLDWMERLLLVEVLGLTRGNQSRAARLLGITRGSLRYKIRTRQIAIGAMLLDHASRLGNRPDP